MENPFHSRHPQPASLVSHHFLVYEKVSMLHPVGEIVMFMKGYHADATSYTNLSFVFCEESVCGG